jgi:hypothetical protein
MNFETQLKGLNDLLVVIFGQGNDVAALLREMGFEQSQVDRLAGDPMQALLNGFVEALHKRLISPTGKDTYFHVLSGRYGLDGEAARSLEQVAQQMGLDPAYVAQLFPEILSHCRAKGMQEHIRRDLKRLAVAQLGQIAGRPTGDQERLSNLRAAQDVTRLDYEAKRSEILKKVQAELDALELEYQPLLDTVQENIDELETQIKTDVLLHGESVSGGTYRAVYTRGRISWDNKGIEKYAEAHPDVLQFRKEGLPSVALRVTGEKD